MNVTKCQEIIPHLRYEWRQLNLMADLLEQYSDRRDEVPPGAWSAYVESFAMHARVLVDVIYRGKKFSSDVTAKDFLQDSSQWPKVRGAANEAEVGNLVERVNQQVAHLTYGRANFSPEEFVWDVRRVVELLRVPMAKLNQQTQQEGKVELLGPKERTFLKPPSTFKVTATTTGVNTPQDKLNTHGRTDI